MSALTAVAVAVFSHVLVQCSYRMKDESEIGKGKNCPQVGFRADPRLGGSSAAHGMSAAGVNCASVAWPAAPPRCCREIAGKLHKPGSGASFSNNVCFQPCRLPFT